MEIPISGKTIFILKQPPDLMAIRSQYFDVWEHKAHSLSVVMETGLFNCAGLVEENIRN